MKSAIRWAPKLSVALIARLYTSDAQGVPDEDLADDVGWQMLARCHDVLRVSDSLVVCPTCGATFDVPWIGRDADEISTRSGCGNYVDIYIMPIMLRARLCEVARQGPACGR